MSSRELSRDMVFKMMKTVRERPALSRKDAERIAGGCCRSLRAHSAGQLRLAPNVRLRLPSVLKTIWEVRKHAVAEIRRHDSPYLDS